MIDVVGPLRKKINDALEATDYPVYYEMAPDNENSDCYLVFGSISQSNADTKSSEDVDVRYEIRIHTKQDKYNAGDIMDTAAGAVYSAMSAMFDLSADGMQNISQNRDTDNVLNYGAIGNNIFMDRIITFKHKIFIQ